MDARSKTSIIIEKLLTKANEFSGTNEVPTKFSSNLPQQEKFTYAACGGPGEYFKNIIKSLFFNQVRYELQPGKS